MIYRDYHRNYAVPAGYEDALHVFLNQELDGKRHKIRHAANSNSEDALTWSCFQVLDSLPVPQKTAVLNEIIENAYQGKKARMFLERHAPQIHVGKEYIGAVTGESTETDASVEWADKLIIIEAKLYSSISLTSQQVDRDQIARKLRVGLDSPLGEARELFFIFLDLAPAEKMRKGSDEATIRASNGATYHDKWKSAWMFHHYQTKTAALAAQLDGIATPPPAQVAANMGWLTWGDLFKSILRGVAAGGR